MNAANIITMSRIALIPIFLLFLKGDMTFLLAQADPMLQSYIALAIFILASVTDSVDGHIARKYNMITNFGKFMDPLADKLLVAAAIVVFVEMGKMPAIAAILIIAREFVVTSLRVVAMSEGVVIPAAFWGKLKTVVQIICISIMMTKFSEIYIINDKLHINDVAVWVMVIVTVYSGIDYMVKNRDLISKGMGA